IAPDKKINILYSLALDFMELKDNDSAIAALNELISVDSHNRRAKEKLLDLYSRIENWEAAYEIKESLIKNGGGKSKKGLAIYKYLMGKKLATAKEYHKARLMFKEAIHFDAACTPAYLAIGDSYQAENRMDDAIAIWRKMISQVPDEAHLALGRLEKVLFDVGKYGEISSICNDILAVGNKNLTARLMLADYYAKKGDISMAIEHLNTAMDNHPNSSLPVLELIKLYHHTDKKKEVARLLFKLEDKFENIEDRHVCNRCGYKHKTKLWLCPSCKAVDSFNTQ
ncbi:MAG: tetratricopeptide repeat protein, partial [Candidatus Zixiibacteriota bacterium]